VLHECASLPEPFMLDAIARALDLFGHIASSRAQISERLP
jgi:hypothetical protein